jgi:hypothetical protein
MKLFVVTVATATVLASAFPQTTPVLAQGADIGAASRPYPLDGGLPAGSDDRGQSSKKSEGSEQSGDLSSEKSQTVGKTGKTLFREHHAVSHKHTHRVSALGHPRHHHLIHRRGHRVVALNELASWSKERPALLCVSFTSTA